MIIINIFSSIFLFFLVENFSVDYLKNKEILNFKIINSEEEDNKNNKEIELNDFKFNKKKENKKEILVKIETNDFKKEFFNFTNTFEYLRLNEKFNINFYDNDNNLKNKKFNFYNNSYENINHLKLSKNKFFKEFYFKTLKIYASMFDFITEAKDNIILEEQQGNNNQNFNIFLNDNNYLCMNQKAEKKFRSLNNSLVESTKKFNILSFYNDNDIKNTILENEEIKTNFYNLNKEYRIFFFDIVLDFVKIYEKGIFYVDYMIDNSSSNKIDNNKIYLNISEERIIRLNDINKNFKLKRIHFFDFLNYTGFKIFNFLDNVDEYDNNIKIFLDENFFKSNNLLKSLKIK